MSDFALQRVSVDDARRLAESGEAVLVDVRPHAGSRQAYGAVRYDAHKLAEAQHLSLPLPRDGTPLILYDERDGQDALTAAEALHTNGFENLSILEGGFAAWEAAGARTEETTIEQAVPEISGAS